MTKKTVIVGIMIMVTGLLLQGCGPKKTTVKNQPLTFNLSAEPSILNPILYTDAASSEVVGLVFSGLLRVSTNMELMPDLAESYTISEDGLRYTFNLMKTATWHDGAPVTAEDVVFTFEKILDITTNAVRRSN